MSEQNDRELIRNLGETLRDIFTASDWHDGDTIAKKNKLARQGLRLIYGECPKCDDKGRVLLDEPYREWWAGATRLVRFKKCPFCHGSNYDRDAFMQAREQSDE
jgi:hypothetical protein